MDLFDYLLNGVFEATTPPNESAAVAQSRADAIVEMFHAYDPGDGMEAMLACQCITLQFLLTAAMRDANNTSQEPAAQSKARAGAISASRTLHQWVTKFENARKRNERHAAEAAKTRAAAQPAADPPSTPSPANPVPQPAPSPADRPAPRSPAPNGEVTTASGASDPLLAAGAALRSAGSGPGCSGSGVPNAPPLSPPAEVSDAA
ncbi:MAG: hypothetical protein ABSE20_29505 [Acetobacteraceae bacterium]|jgi:hypothetical protein